MNAPAQQHGRPKAPPHSLDAEQSLLGGLMQSGAAWYDIVHLVGPHDFYRPQHTLIFGAMGALIDANLPVDPLTVADRLGEQGELEKAGGMAYLAELVESTPSARNVEAYARIVRECAIERSLLAVAQQIGDLAFGEGRVADKLNEAQALVMQLTLEQRLARARSMREVLKGVVHEVEQRFTQMGEVRGITTGFLDLDHRWRGLKPGNLYVLAGRPSMGKTTLAMNIAEQVGLQGHRVLVFSLEMTAEELAERSIASLGGIAHQDLESGNVMARPDGPPLFTGAVSRLAGVDVLIDDTAAMDVTRIRARVRQASIEKPVELIVIDHLQLMSGEGRTQNDVIREITKGLKGLAKEMHCPVLLLSQLNREVDKRPYGKNRPIMSDLRDSGTIEQDSDIIAFVYRNVRYKPNTAFADVAEIITAKFRNGRIGTDYLRADLEHCRFQNYGGERPQYDSVASSSDAGFPED